jgi:AAA domain
MTFRLITASERLAQETAKTTALVCGPAKIGKTSLARDFDPATTLFIDFEAGTESIQDWLPQAHHTDTIRTWEDAVDLVCLIGGVDPASLPGDMFSAGHYDVVCARYPTFPMDQINLIFCDSVTELAKRCSVWAQQQPEAFAWNPRKGVKGEWVPDIRGMYGLIGRSMPRLLKHLQYAPSRTVVYVAGLECYVDDTTKREIWRIQMEGQATSTALSYIVSNIISYDLFDWSDAVGSWLHNPIKGSTRGFVCQRQNPFNLPAGNRAPRNRPLEMMEEPNLRKLIEKINPSFGEQDVRAKTQ